jgi:hypothetical protein
MYAGLPRPYSESGERRITAYTQHNVGLVGRIAVGFEKTS